MLWTILFWAAIAVGAAALLYLLLAFIITAHLVRIAMEEGETGWHD